VTKGVEFKPGIIYLKNHVMKQASNYTADPVKKYPQPPYPEQEQEMPGRESEMDPRPDHGETTL